MPGKLQTDDSSRKRKRLASTKESIKDDKPRKALKRQTSDGNDLEAEILLLEEQIAKSQKHYKDIDRLQDILFRHDARLKQTTLAAVSLCRVFSRLIVGRDISVREKANDAENEVGLRLREQLNNYTTTLSTWLGHEDAILAATALTLLMRIVKAEITQDIDRAHVAWRNKTGTFFTTVKAVLENPKAGAAREAFVENYLEEHDDVRFYTFLVIRQVLTEQKSKSEKEELANNAIDLLSKIGSLPETEDALDTWFSEESKQSEKQLQSLNAHQKVAREAWISIFRSCPSQAQRKYLLSIFDSNILPWFNTRVELLVDFLTDSFNAGGSSSLLALSGIFHLMTERNLDYPEFYTKLYSLLDENVLHSKHRSRFFRLMEKFMSSSHLPAAMVASFLKRLARLALQAPPGAIVFVIPWTYNILKQHPACTFMIHRVYHPAHAIYKTHPDYVEEGMDDPFDMKQDDPMLTHAIDSSLWELETLQSHYHPNVATLAKILSEQFTKREYQLEDFLDHNYTTLIDAELTKPMKKDPVVEWDIPKHIVTAPDGSGGLNALGGLLQHAIDLM